MMKNRIKFIEDLIIYSVARRPVSLGQKNPKKTKNSAPETVYQVLLFEVAFLISYTRLSDSLFVLLLLYLQRKYLALNSSNWKIWIN